MNASHDKKDTFYIYPMIPNNDQMIKKNMKKDKTTCTGQEHNTAQMPGAG